MNYKFHKNLCPICGGLKRKGRTTYTVDIGFSVIVVRDVPAMICSQCGEEWIGADTARELEVKVEDARQKKRQAEIVAM